MRAAKETQRDLEWTQKKVRLVSTDRDFLERPANNFCSAMNRRAAERYPEQYRAATQRYPAPVDY